MVYWQNGFSRFAYRRGRAATASPAVPRRGKPVKHLFGRASQQNDDTTDRLGGAFKQFQKSFEPRGSEGATARSLGLGVL
jgi:hypothetical protein